jgi:hypothetical protein
MAPYPGQARCLALGFWPECFRRLNVKAGRRPFPKETRSALDIEGKHVTIQGPSPDPTSSVPSGLLLGDVAHVRQARSRCLRHCPRVTVIPLSRPPHRARGGHGPLRSGLAAPLGVWPSSQLARCAGSRAGAIVRGHCCIFRTVLCAALAARASWFRFVRAEPICSISLPCTTPHGIELQPKLRPCAGLLPPLGWWRCRRRRG